MVRPQRPLRLHCVPMLPFMRQTNPKGLCRTDISGDGEWRLLAACTDKRMRVLQGMTLASSASLLDEPAAAASFYADYRKPRVPSVAVASGAYVFIYRNMRPYLKVCDEVPVRAVYMTLQLVAATNAGRTVAQPNLHA